VRTYSLPPSSGTLNTIPLPSVSLHVRSVCETCTNFVPTPFAEAALDDTLAELELDYLDLYLIHWPVNFGPGKNPHSDLFPATSDPNEVNIDNSIPNSETWKAMNKLPKSKARSVGVSNFTYQTLKALIEKTDLVPAVNQIERHPILPSKELIGYAKEKNIHITAYSAFGNNFFDIPLLITRPEVKAIAEKKGATPAQVILAWSQVGGHSVIPKSVTPSRIAENFKEIELSEEDIAAIQKFSDEHQGRRRYNVPYTASKWHMVKNFMGGEDELTRSCRQTALEHQHLRRARRARGA
jgi:L-glyceraldehyde reductase